VRKFTDKVAELIKNSLLQLASDTSAALKQYKADREKIAEILRTGQYIAYYAATEDEVQRGHLFVEFVNLATQLELDCANLGNTYRNFNHDVAKSDPINPQEIIESVIKTFSSTHDAQTLILGSTGEGSNTDL
jgi:hypothetical protein